MCIVKKVVTLNVYQRSALLFNMGDLSTLRELCENCGINSKRLTKIECILRLKSAVESVADIDKLFFKVWHASGGTLTGTCPHGVVYIIKHLLKAESPRDISDILLSLRHPPNVVISDIPHMLAAHTNKRSTNFFNHFAGRIFEPTNDNIKAAHEGVLAKQSFPWLNRRIEKTTSDIKLDGTTIHPLTLVQQRLSLYDKFHQTNTKQKKEILRRTEFVKELDGVVTETAEQLNNFLSKSI